MHAIGRANDIMIPMIGGDADNTLGDRIANWLIENAEYIGVQRVIWDGNFWNGRGSFGPLNAGAAPHRDHIHMELSIDGAARRTRFFTEGPPASTCPVVCYGTAAVRADCSYTDCAATGQVCMDAVCVAGAPPEPSAAVRNAGAVLPTVASLGPLSRFNFVSPQRIFDTRLPTTSASLSRSDGATSGPLTATRTGTFSSWTGLPASASAVWLNVAAVPGTAPGFIQVFPAGPTPEASTVNFIPARVRANATAVSLGTGSGVTFRSNTDVDVIADLTGAFAPTGLGLQTAGPTRVLDTRSVGMPLVGNTPYPVDVRAPASASGVVATVTVLAGTEPGFLTAFPCGAGIPTTSNVNFAAGTVIPNAVISELSAGQLCFLSNVPVGLIVDVTGYLVPVGELSYQAISPARLLDTRSPSALYAGRLGDRQVIELPIQSLAGMPAGASAAVVNIVSANALSAGFLTTFPCGGPVPSTSSLNFNLEGPAAALNMTPLGGGNLCIFASARTHVVVDLVGVWVPTPSAPPPTPGPGPIDPEDPDEFGPPEDAGVSGGDAGLLGNDDAGGETFDGASNLDAGQRRDSGLGLTSTGCTCRVTRGKSAFSAVTMVLLALAIALRRRTRR